MMGLLREYNEVMQLLKEKQQVVFYAETRHYYPYFQQLIEDLQAVPGLRICYITSDANDHLLRSPGTMRVVYVKWMLGFLFSKLRAFVMIMTMPDLDNYLFKRSAGVENYIYLFHAAVSTHQQYRKAAFNNYDTIFCLGDYQQAEIRKNEAVSQLPPKELIAYGYPLFSALRLRALQHEMEVKEKRTILIAPSWFEGCIFETCFEELLSELTKLPYDVIIRSHPEYEKRKKKHFKQIQKLVAREPNMKMDTQASVNNSLVEADILITDRSGIALEFAFGMGRPVLFIETAPKQTNREWQELGIEPIENSLRDKIGIKMLPTELATLPDKLSSLEEISKGFTQKAHLLEQQFFYDTAKGRKTGIAFIKEKLRLV